MGMFNPLNLLKGKNSSAIESTLLAFLRKKSPEYADLFIQQKNSGKSPTQCIEALVQNGTISKSDVQKGYDAYANSLGGKNEIDNNVEGNNFNGF